MWLFEYFSNFCLVSELDRATFPRGRRWMSQHMGRRQGLKDLAELRRRLDVTRASEVLFTDLTLTSLDVLYIHLFSLSQVEWSL